MKATGLSLPFMNNASGEVIVSIKFLIKSFAENALLFDEINFHERANAIDYIDFHIIDRIEGLLQDAEMTGKLNTLKQYAEGLKCRLEKIDSDLFKNLREQTGNGNYTGTSFIQIILPYLKDYFASINRTDQQGYDNLDIFMNGFLSDQVIPEPIAAIKPEMVFYQKTPARIVLSMVEPGRLEQDDVFFDIGSGLGQVAILVNLLSACKVRGIEYDPAYCNYATICASRLNLSNVEFIHTDALKANYAEGTVFFLYTPFEGDSLQCLLGLLKKEAEKRSIRIFTYGPCSVIVAREPWLGCLNGSGDNHYTLYMFRSLITMARED